MRVSILIALLVLAGCVSPFEPAKVAGGDVVSSVDPHVDRYAGHTRHRVLFDFASATPDEMAPVIEALPSQGEIIVRGYTDPEGDRQTNQALAGARAFAVADRILAANPDLDVVIDPVGPRARGGREFDPIARQALVLIYPETESDDTDTNR